MFLLPFISIHTVKVCLCLTCTEAPALNALCSLLLLQLSVSPPSPHTQNMAVVRRHAAVSMPFTKASDTETQQLKLLQQKKNEASCDFCVFVKEIRNLLKEAHCCIKQTIKPSYIYTNHNNRRTRLPPHSFVACVASILDCSAFMPGYRRRTVTWDQENNPRHKDLAAARWTART